MTDNDFVYFIVLLCIEAALLLGMLSSKLSIPRFTAGSVVVIPLLCLFGLNARMTKISVGAMTIDTKVDEARTYANEIRNIRDDLIKQHEIVSKATLSLAHTSDVVKELAAKNVEAGNKITQVNEQIKKGEQAVEKLEIASDFASTCVAAVNDSRIAFNRLNDWASDISYPFNGEAVRAVKAINSSSTNLLLDYAVPWNQGVDPAKFDLNSLKQQLQSLDSIPQSNAEIRIAFIQYIARRADFSKHDRAQFLIDVIKSTPSMKILTYSANEFGQLTGFKDVPRTSAPLYEQWWTAHAMEVK